MSVSVLAFAVASGKVGYVFIADGEVQDWAICTSVSGDTVDLVAYAQNLLNTHQPNVVVTEACGKGCRKGAKTKQLIGAIAGIASHNYVLDVSVQRPRHFASKYEEATELAKRHPNLLGYLPQRKRRIFDEEPRGMILFEAVALAEAFIFGPSDQLAAAMG